MQAADLVLPEIKEILAQHPSELLESLEEFHPVDVAHIYTRLVEEDARAFINALPIELLASVFEQMERREKRAAIQQLPGGRASKLIEWMSPDDRADFLQELSDETREALLATVDRQIVREIRALMNYAPDSAGGIMTTELVRVPETFSADQTIAEVRRLSLDNEMIYTIYVSDTEAGQLLGVMSLRDVLMAKPDALVSDIMTTQVISVRYDVEQREAATLISKYDLLSLPVVDNYGRLIGMVTVDDVLDVVQEESADNMQRMGAMQPMEESYFEAPFFVVLRKRAFWLVLLFVGELFTTTALRHFEKALEQAVALMFFVPLIVSSGGNSGSQSATLIIRSIATGEVAKHQLRRIFTREAGIGASLGLILGAFGLLRAFSLGQNPAVAIAVGLTLLCVVTIGAMVGAALPLFFSKIGLDPAVSSTPFIASLVDVVGIVTYFSIAQWLLHLS